MDGVSELNLLREFYSCWVSFHATKPAADQSPEELRAARESAAQELVDAANAVERCQKKAAH